MAPDDGAAYGDDAEIFELFRVDWLRRKVRAVAEAKAVEAGLATDKFDRFQITEHTKERTGGGVGYVLVPGEGYVTEPNDTTYLHFTDGPWKERLWKVKTSD